MQASGPQRLPPSPPDRPRTSRSWAVVGGGLMGMALALELTERGERVSLFEGEQKLGGLTAPWRLGQVEWDRFYHVIVNVDRHLLALLAKLGLDTSVRWVETRAGFFSGGEFHSMSSALDFLRFAPLSLYQRLRLGLTILYGSRFGSWETLEQVPVEDWLRRVSGDGTFETLWLPLLKSKLGDDYRRTSAAFIWAYIRRMYSARQSGLKREQFGYVPGGYSTIIKTLVARLATLGVEIQTGAAVHGIGRTRAQLQLTFEDGTRRCFTHAVSTLPPRLTSRLCSQLSEQEHRRAAAIEYIGVVCPSLLLEKPLGPYYVTNILDRGVPLTGVIEMTTVVDPSELDGHHLVYLPRYVSEADSAAFGESDAVVEARSIEVLKAMYPQFRARHVKAFQVARARRVMALPTLGYSQRLPAEKTSVEGLFAINSAAIVDGVLNVDSTLGVAQRAFLEHLLPLLSTP